MFIGTHCIIFWIKCLGPKIKFDRKRSVLNVSEETIPEVESNVKQYLRVGGITRQQPGYTRRSPVAQGSPDVAVTCLKGQRSVHSLLLNLKNSD